MGRSPFLCFGLLAVAIIFSATPACTAPADDSAFELSPRAREILSKARRLEHSPQAVHYPSQQPFLEQTDGFNPYSFKNIDDELDEATVTDVDTNAPDAPHWVVYGDQYIPGSNGPPPVSSIKGYNVYALSFLLLAGPWDKAYEWTSLSDAERSALKAQYAKAGIKLIVSAFGATDAPTTTRSDPKALATRFADWIKKYALDGIDIDYEDFGAMDQGTAEDWLIALTTTLRQLLPAPTYIITHAPVAPWFTPSLYRGGGYLKVHKNVGQFIDWYNVQFYNQGATEYTTCNGLFNQSSSNWPKTSVFEIAASGVPASKIVVGKPAAAADASNGYMSPGTLATCLQLAKAQGWNGGAMFWQHPHATTDLIKTVRSKSWPVDASIPAPPAPEPPECTCAAAA